MRSLRRHAASWLSKRGSTRAAGLIRIALAFLLWLTWGDDFTLFRLATPERLIVALAFYSTTAAMLVGLWSRWATLACAAVVAFIYYKLGVLDGAKGFVHHHTALLVFATCICALTPCGASFSVDRWLTVRRARGRGTSPPAEAGPTWALSLYGVLVSMVYFGGAVSKSTVGWLSGDRLEQIVAHYYGFASYPSTPWIGRLFLVATVGVVVLEYALTIGLWFRRSRRWLVPAGISLHIGFYVLLPVETFSLTMLLLYVSYSPQMVDRITVAASAADPDIATNTLRARKVLPAA